MDQLNTRDDALFEALSKSKKQRKRKRVLMVLIIVIIIAAALIALVAALRNQVRETLSTLNDEVLSYQAAYGTINTTVSGSGTIYDVDAETVTLPAGVDLLEVIVEANETVREGQVLATVDMASVLRAMADVQSQIEATDQRLSNAGGDKVSSYVNAGVAGRVKKVYAQVDDDVAGVMVRNGTLALISLDGYMAFTVETDVLSAGDTVNVRRADGSELSGSVDLSVNGTAVILVTDNGPELDEEVAAVDAEGSEIGSGSLSIHNPLGVTGFAGTVSSVSVRENQAVTAGTRLFTLTDTAYSANYDAILRERQELEETLMDLLALYRDGAVLAPFDGTVLRVESDGGTQAPQVQTAAYSGYAAGASAANTASADDTDVVTLTRDIQMRVSIPVGESDILALRLGQSAEITLDSLGDFTFDGTVTEIDKTAGSQSGGTAYSAVVTFDKAERMLSGMSANVVIRIDGTENVLIVPADAVHKTSASAYVYTSYDAERGEYGGAMAVTLGASNKDYCEIVSGLNEGDTVYYTEIQRGSNFFGPGGR